MGIFLKASLIVILLAFFLNVSIVSDVEVKSWVTSCITHVSSTFHYLSFTTISPSTEVTLDPDLFNPDLYTEIHSLWFYKLSLPASAPSKVQLGRWFGHEASPEARIAFDEDCRSVALRALTSVGPDNYPLPLFTDVNSDWVNYESIAAPFIRQLEGEENLEASAEKTLGLILLFDQFTRNIFRDEQALIYAHYDRIARAISERACARGFDIVEKHRASPPHRIWFYYPWMHSESLEDHRRFANKLQEMHSQAEVHGDRASIDYLNLIMDYQKRHEDLVLRFGRYAYRNKVLGRENTAAEDVYLASDPETFGA